MYEFGRGSKFTVCFTSGSRINSIEFSGHHNNLCNLNYDDCNLNKDELCQFENMINDIVERKKLEGMFSEDNYGREFYNNIKCYGNIIINVYKTLFDQDAIVEII